VIATGLENIHDNCGTVHGKIHYTRSRDARGTSRVHFKKVKSYPALYNVVSKTFFAESSQPGHNFS
jgi:CMP-2-keto-3-deoxyoctulosonic acid synthetase